MSLKGKKEEIDSIEITKLHIVRCVARGLLSEATISIQAIKTMFAIFFAWKRLNPRGSNESSRLNYILHRVDSNLSATEIRLNMFPYRL